jgi:hypothetical protein
MVEWALQLHKRPPLSGVVEGSGPLKPGNLLASRLPRGIGTVLSPLREIGEDKGRCMSRMPLSLSVPGRGFLMPPDRPFPEESLAGVRRDTETKR